MASLVLDIRLSTIASLVDSTECVADVGCDHGYLSAFLLIHHLASRIYATDLHSAPLQRAAATFKRYGLLQNTVLLQCDGLTDVPPTVQTIVIAGMGGETICSILQNASWIKDKNKILVLQPMSREEYLRRWLYEQGFAIVEEKKVLDGAYCYVVFKVCFTGNKVQLSDLESVIGRLNLPEGSEDFVYIQKKIQKYKAIIQGKLSAHLEIFSVQKERELVAGLEALLKLEDKNDS